MKQVCVFSDFPFPPSLSVAAAGEATAIGAGSGASHGEGDHQPDGHGCNAFVAVLSPPLPAPTVFLSCVGKLEEEGEAIAVRLHCGFSH